MTLDSILLGDCLIHLRTLPNSCADLIYLDPPFFTQKLHTLGNRRGDRKFSFSDVWTSSTDYADFLHDRLCEMKRVLRPTGSLFFHCDRNSTHIARFVLDDVFGADQFRSEIIWCFRRWSNAAKGLLPAHQNVFFYSKTSDFKFNPVTVAYSPTTNVDQILQRRVRDVRGKTVYKRDEVGDIVSNGAKNGVPLSDVWEIPYLNPKAKERVGYPTQKPILLLERVIELVTNEGDTVLDPFCGSGTTLVASKLLNRHWIGIDSSEDAVGITKERLLSPIKTASNLMEKGIDAYLNGETLVDSVMWGTDHVKVHRNKGIDCILKQEIDGQPVLVRIQRDHETIYDTATALRTAAQNKGGAVLLVVAVDSRNDLLAPTNSLDDIIIIQATSWAITAAVDSLQKMNAKVRRGEIKCVKSRKQTKERTEWESSETAVASSFDV